MRTWLISDMHFGHKNIARFCNRPDNHEELMWEGLRLVSKRDRLVVLGDVALMAKKDCMFVVDKLPGQERILLEGNHDVSTKIRKHSAWDQVVRYDEALITSRLVKDGPLMALSHTPTTLSVIKGPKIFLHGHIHNAGYNYMWTGGSLWVNLSVEQWDYKPVLLDDIIKMYKRGKNAL